MNDAVPVARKTRVRRRRRWYRRQLRRRRIFIAVMVGVVVAGACVQKAVSHFVIPSLTVANVLPASFWARADIHKDLAFAAIQSKPKKVVRRIPGVYPYSVVPGGVKDVSDLRYAALRDYVVRRHYSHFDFEHARLERAKEAREVYLSYRIRDKIFWTRRKAHLRVGELLLTDGNITARAKCGNQISDTAKPEVSQEEPDEDVMDQPVAAVDDAPYAPVRPLLASLDLPTGQPVGPAIVGGPFSFPYVPIGLPIPSGKCPAGETVVDGKCKKHHKKPVVPEPSTLLLLGSGLALILWRYLKTTRPQSA